MAEAVKAATPWPAWKVAAAALCTATVAAIALGVGLGVGLPNDAVPLASQTPNAVVIVAGGGATSPFTSPWEDCEPLPGCNTSEATCWRAGSTASYAREFLAARGRAVYTAPSTIGTGTAAADGGEGGFARCGRVLPPHMTINSIGDIDLAGQRLAEFVTWLAATHGVRRVDFLGHSMGGLYAAAAVRELRFRASAVRVRSLTTLGTPHRGQWAADMYMARLGYAGSNTTACQGDALCQLSASNFAEAATHWSQGAGQEVSQAYLDAWQRQQAQDGLLEGVAVHLLAGSFFGAPQPATASADVWPTDGAQSVRSALAQDLRQEVLPPASIRLRKVYADVHSLSFARLAGLPLQRALPFDPAVLADVEAALRALD